jgi:hypothetical protein
VKLSSVRTRFFLSEITELWWLELPITQTHFDSPFEFKPAKFYCIVAISAYHHLSCELESLSWQVVLDTTLCDKVCQWLAAGLWFSLSTQVSSTNKTDCHDIAEILLKVAFNTISLTPLWWFKSLNHLTIDLSLLVTHVK